ncbi:MAG TPA: restriction endonuclease [Burkholderiales bacterium]|nr:restriction endonuclease [Burkholderiales bacterium]
MKFRISENSLYAVLMRSPWWVSFLVAAGVFALVRLVLPEGYAAFAISPLVIIGVIAAWRQLRVPRGAALEKRLQALRALPWEAFAPLLEQAWRRAGYQVAPFAGAGADYELSKAGRGTLVACKRWKASRTGVEPLRELTAARKAHGAGDCAYLAVGEITDTARDFATKNDVKLLQGAELAKLVRRAGA